MGRRSAANALRILSARSHPACSTFWNPFARVGGYFNGKSRVDEKKTEMPVENAVESAPIPSYPSSLQLSLPQDLCDTLQQKLTASMQDHASSLAEDVVKSGLSAAQETWEQRIKEMFALHAKEHNSLLHETENRLADRIQQLEDRIQETNKYHSSRLDDIEMFASHTHQRSNQRFDLLSGDVTEAKEQIEKCLTFLEQKIDTSKKSLEETVGRTAETLQESCTRIEKAIEQKRTGGEEGETLAHLQETLRALESKLRGLEKLLIEQNEMTRARVGGAERYLGGVVVEQAEALGLVARDMKCNVNRHANMMNLHAKKRTKKLERKLLRGVWETQESVETLRDMVDMSRWEGLLETWRHETEMETAAGNLCKQNETPVGKIDDTPLRVSEESLDQRLWEPVPVEKRQETETASPVSPEKAVSSLPPQSVKETSVRPYMCAPTEFSMVIQVPETETETPMATETHTEKETSPPAVSSAVSVTKEEELYRSWVDKVPVSGPSVFSNVCDDVRAHTGDIIEEETPVTVFGVDGAHVCATHTHTEGNMEDVFGKYTTQPETPTPPPTSSVPPTHTENLDRVGDIETSSTDETHSETDETHVPVHTDTRARTHAQDARAHMRSLFRNDFDFWPLAFPNSHAHAFAHRLANPQQKTPSLSTSGDGETASPVPIEWVGQEDPLVKKASGVCVRIHTPRGGGVCVSPPRLKGADGFDGIF
eukprot:GDKI01005682.1.p1 GENE.GDKI01005682.1~~GDKI01005682.1.p1  ORF type:complete len:711 (-),score=209.70 GDKI01005682.1:27-2159(-)